METDACFHNLKQRFDSNEGLHCSSPTKMPFSVLWSTSDALFLQCVPSGLIPPISSWIHSLCGTSRSRCSNGAECQFYLSNLRKQFSGDACVGLNSE